MAYILAWSSAEALDVDITQGKADEKGRKNRDYGHGIILSEENPSRRMSTDCVYKLLVHL